MPTTGTGNLNQQYVIGVDGCRAGWVYVGLNLSTSHAITGVAPSFQSIMDIAAMTSMIVVDMPIGLADAGRRQCEAEARSLLKPLRHSSVFSSPRRPMLEFDRYETANAWGKAQCEGGGLSKQAWMITPKIREVDASISPTDQKRICEGHPEVAFFRLNGGQPCVFPKRIKKGQAERRALLLRHGVNELDRLYDEVRADAGAKVGLDDLYDASALALTAKARLNNQAVHLTGNARDARGLIMEIWG